MKYKQYVDYRNIMEQISHIPLTTLLAKFIPIKRTTGLNDLGISPFSHDTGYSHFRINKEKNLWFDYSLGIYGDAIDFFRKLYHLSYHDAIYFILQNFPEYFVFPQHFDLKKLQLSDLQRIKLQPQMQQTAAPKTKPPAKSPVLLDLAYRLFLDTFPLSHKDRHYLKSRHLSSAEIKKYHFFSMPYCNPTNRNRFNRVLFQYGFKTTLLRHVPGFYEVDQQLYWQNFYGIGIPTYNAQGYIVGIQVRVTTDHPQGARYLWFSSAAKLDQFGSSPGAPIYVLNPHSSQQTILITEGFFKGNEYYKTYHYTVLTLAGVGNFKEIATVLEQLNQPQAQIIISFDADAMINPAVLKQEQRLITTLQKLGYSDIQMLYWDYQAGKGFDDLKFNHPQTYQQYLHQTSVAQFLKFVQQQKGDASIIHEKSN